MKTTTELGQLCEDTLSSVLGWAVYFLKTLRFNMKNPQQLISVCLYSRLLELATACKALLEKNALVGIPILYRSIFEADIDLTNCITTPEYFKRMHAAFLKEKLRVTKEAASPRSNSYLAAVKIERDSKADMIEIQKELDELNSEENGPMSIRDRAALANKLDRYVAVYSMLCLDSHNNVRSLEEWHIDRSSTNDNHVVAFKQAKADMILHLFDISNILLLQTKSLADFLEIGDIEFDRYFRELNHLEDTLVAHSDKTI